MAQTEDPRASAAQAAMWAGPPGRRISFIFIAIATRAPPAWLTTKRRACHLFSVPFSHQLRPGQLTRQTTAH
ncbi:hypothetical protein [Paraburkholderia acidipaludis]|uniref:hypothetical protein n=1 Tax=Paraburkholderia acidipaludis TaxID=660537 RepID=UPI00047F0E8A|nr:hypothetical protein [Paraburkholderia acidipaludis]